MIPLFIVTGAALAVSFIFDWKKTLKGLKKGGMMFLSMLLPFITVLVFVSLLLALLPQETIVRILGKESGPLGFFIAAAAGSVSLLPGFVAFPLGSILIKMQVGYAVVAVFLTTLLMVGVVTLPLEAKFFGLKTSILRNALCLGAALLVGLLVGLFWGMI